MDHDLVYSLSADTYHTNPQYSFEIKSSYSTQTETPSTVMVGLMQKIEKNVDKFDLPAIGFIIYSVGDFIYKWHCQVYYISLLSFEWPVLLTKVPNYDHWHTNEILTTHFDSKVYHKVYLQELVKTSENLFSKPGYLSTKANRFIRPSSHNTR